MGKSEKAKKINNRSETWDSAEIITDPRFASVHSDPRFQKVPKHKAKVEIDSRFDGVLTDKRFASSDAPVDKRGKPKKKQDSENFLRHYYRRTEESKAEEEEDEATEEDERKGEELAKRGGEESETESSSDSESYELEEDEAESLELDTDEDDDDEWLHMELDDEPEQPEEHVPEIEKETHRLAVVNMDWRYVKAVDLYVTLGSFLPKNGQIVSIAVYPSEFGLQRMKEEEVHGPVGLFDDESEKNGDDDDDDDNEIDNEKLRAYEKSRLRYFYAVVECDSVATADYLYKACDGLEFERSSNVLDLRFIPDSMEFKQPPRDVATEAPANYEGLNFQSRALQQSKIQISWDEDEPDRVKKLRRNLDVEQLEEMEVKEFLASDESGSEEDEPDKKEKKLTMYRALLKPGDDASDGDNEEEGQDMEVTFNTGLEDISKHILEKKDKKQETVWETKLREKHERKKRRKNRSKHSSDDDSSDADQEDIEEPGDFFVEEPSVKKRKKSNGKTAKRKKQQEDTNGQAEATKDELELLLADDTIGDKSVKGYNLKPKKVKGKHGKKVKEVLEEDKIPPIADDPRFSSLFTSPDFAMDPTDPQFKRSATYARQVALSKAQKESAERESAVPAEPQTASTDEKVKSNVQASKREKYELSTLLKSVKMKSRNMKLPSIGKA